MQSVVHVCTDFWPSTGGIQQFVHDLALRSTRAGLRVTVLCFNRVRGFPGRLPETEFIGPIAIRRISFLNLIYYKPVLIPQALLRSHDLIHVHGVGAPLDYIALTKSLHRKPIVVSTHGGIFHTATLSHLKRLYFFGMQRFILRRVDMIAACSFSDARLFSRIATSVRVIENAAELQAHMALPLDRKQPGRCLYVGRLSRNKGVDLLLRAAAEAKSCGASFNLRVVGPDAEGNASRLVALAATLGISDCTSFLGELFRAELS